MARAASDLALALEMTGPGHDPASAAGEFTRLEEEITRILAALPALIPEGGR